MINQEKKIEEFRPLTCGRCKLQNSPASKFCTKCGYALSAEIAINAESENKKSSAFMNEIMKDSELKELIIRKMLNKGLFPEFFEVK